MKYMGSKTALLAGRLGELVLEQAGRSDRFIDLFSGSGAVSHWVAEAKSIPVVSIDVQEYARVLAGCVTERTNDMDHDELLSAWTVRGITGAAATVSSVADVAELDTADVHSARVEAGNGSGFIERSYGGHYFSLQQARALDSMYESMPSAEPQRTVALAALIQAASVCAAAPGHTAQPFQPTKSLLPFIRAAWARDVHAEVRKALATLSPRHALAQGSAKVGNALEVANELLDGDFVFCDPPYSAVQYSRFYHVLEGIAVGGWPAVSGAGRSPERAARHASAFSMKSHSTQAMKDLLEALRKRDLRVMITFPDADASNGLSGGEIQRLAADGWNVELHLVDSVHSTLGGGAGEGGRGGRRVLKEAVIILEPKTVAVAIQFPFESAAPTQTPGLERASA